MISLLKINQLETNQPKKLKHRVCVYVCVCLRVSEQVCVLCLDVCVGTCRCVCFCVQVCMYVCGCKPGHVSLPGHALPAPAEGF